MITQSLLDYIKSQLAQGVNRETIKSALMSQGWSPSDIEEGFSNLSTPIPPQHPVMQNNSINYQKVATVQPQAVVIGYGGFWLRVLALFIDLFVLSLFSIALYFIGLTGSFFFFLASVIYFIVLESSSYQATIGKMLCGIKVSDLNGGRISIGRATGRYFSKIISAVIIGIGFLMVSFTKNKQGLHDKIAKTLVVKTKKLGAFRAILMIVLLILLLVSENLFTGHFHINTGVNLLRFNYSLNNNGKTSGASFNSSGFTTTATEQPNQVASSTMPGYSEITGVMYPYNVVFPSQFSFTPVHSGSDTEILSASENIDSNHSISLNISALPETATGGGLTSCDSAQQIYNMPNHTSQATYDVRTSESVQINAMDYYKTTEETRVNGDANSGYVPVSDGTYSVSYSTIQNGVCYSLLETSTIHASTSYTDHADDFKILDGMVNSFTVKG
jgi:uncharacterized RDD family membrane protein YckC